MKKAVVLTVFLFAILFVSLVSAQNETVEEKAYSCLQNKVEDKCDNLQIEEQSFSLLASAYNSGIKSECIDALKEKSSNNECWPSSGCKIKDTSLALLALNYAKTDTDKIEKWLLSKNKTSPLEWYLEIDSSTATSCTLTYDTSSKSISISEDKKISGSPGSCFELAYDSYWLKIEPTCLRKNITVSCNKDFISTLLFKKTGSNVWHVSSNVESSSSGGKTQHTVNAFCFSTGSDCNYEDNLWAVLALKQSGNDVSAYTSYLIAMAEDNDKYFPSSILYYLTSSDEYLNKILTLQKTEGYWDLGEKGKFYDTALALLALTESQAEGNAKSWLGENQGNDGCWNSGNIRDTAFLLWAAYPKAAAAEITPNMCQDYNYYCLSQGECDQVNGSVLNNFDCSGLEVCCDKPAKEKTCTEEGGIICPTGDVCSLSTTTTTDTENCCLGTCNPETLECELAGYNCRASCLDTEETTTDSCNSGDVCCKAKPVGKSYWWLYVLIILIILVVLGIIFRNKLRILLFKLRGGFKTSGVTKTFPKFPPPPTGQPSFRRMIPQMFPPARPVQPARKPFSKPVSKTDKELEETLKKLREMSK